MTKMHATAFAEGAGWGVLVGAWETQQLWMYTLGIALILGAIAIEAHERYT